MQSYIFLLLIGILVIFLGWIVEDGWPIILLGVLILVWSGLTYGGFVS